MEGTRKHITHTGILVLLAAIGLLLKLQPSRSVPSPIVSVDRNIPLSIRISKGKEAVTLRKGEAGWVATTDKGLHTVDTARVIPILAAAEEMEGELVSDSPRSHSIFGVDEASGTSWTLLTTATPRSFR